MSRFVIGGLLIVYGLITTAQASGAFGRGLETPAWLSWWPTLVGRSWLPGSFGLGSKAVSWLAGALWVIEGVAFLGPGTGSLPTTSGGGPWPL